MPTSTKASPKKAPATPSSPAPKSALIASQVDPKQAQKAFAALAAHNQRMKEKEQADDSGKSALPLDGPSGDLQDPSNTVWLQISVKKLNTEKKVKPVRIPLSHPLYDPSSISACLLVKDPQREYKDLLMEQKIKSIARVVGVGKLKGKFKPFDARRALVKDHDIFLVDDRIVPLVPSLCGKVFFDAHKNPISVNITRRKKLKEELNSAISSTYYLQNKGSCSSVKLGFLSSHTASQLSENLMTSLPSIVKRIPGGWSNIQNIEVKTGNSVALPIYNCKLSEIKKVEGLEQAKSSSKGKAKASNSSKREREEEEVKEVEGEGKAESGADDEVLIPAAKEEEEEEDDEEEDLVPTAKKSKGSPAKAKASPAKAKTNKAPATPAKAKDSPAAKRVKTDLAAEATPKSSPKTKGVKASPAKQTPSKESPSKVKTPKVSPAKASPAKKAKK